MMNRQQPADLARGTPAADLLGLVQMFDAGVETARRLRRRRFELLPLLARRMPAALSDSAAIEAACAAARGDPDLLHHPLGPLVWFFLHQTYAGAAQGGPIARAAYALMTALTTAANSGEAIDPRHWPNTRVMWRLPAPGIDLGTLPVGLVGAAECRRFAGNLAAGLALLRATSPALADRLARDMRWIVPLAEDRDGGRHSMTIAHLTGVLFIGARSDPGLVAELLIHEFLHTVLHSVSETRVLVEAVTMDKALYSPWREDGRPVEGLLHALYVFSGVLLFWLHHIGAPADAGRAEDRIAMLLLQLRTGVDTLRSSAQGDIVQRVAAATDHAIGLARAVSISPSIAASASTRAEHHRRRWLETVGAR